MVTTKQKEYIERMISDLHTYWNALHFIPDYQEKPPQEGGIRIATARDNLRKAAANLQAFLLEAKTADTGEPAPLLVVPVMIHGRTYFVSQDVAREINQLIWDLAEREGPW